MWIVFVQSEAEVDEEVAFFRAEPTKEQLREMVDNSNLTDARVAAVLDTDDLHSSDERLYFTDGRVYSG